MSLRYWRDCPTYTNNVSTWERPPPLQLSRKSGKPIVGHVAVTIGAVFCLIFGMLLLLFPYTARMVTTYYDHGRLTYPVYELNWPATIRGVFQLWGFSIGLVGGLCALKRIKFPVAIMGASFVIVGGCLAIVEEHVVGVTIFIFHKVGTIPLILGVLGTTLIGVSKDEFYPQIYPLPPSRLGTAVLVCGIVGLCIIAGFSLCWLFLPIGLALGFIALIYGVVAVKEHQRFGVAGLVLGIACVLIGFGFWLFWFVSLPYSG